MRANRFQPGEVSLILDAGGGTVDATVYKVKQRYPLRLSKELVPPDGTFPLIGNCSQN
jgi:hypothetical protein